MELVKATDLAVALDDSQYLLCKEIATMREGEILRDECKRIRLQIILGFTRLRMLLVAVKEEPTDQLRKELADWVRWMGRLQKQGMVLLQPGGAARIGKGKSAIEMGADHEIPGYS